MTSRGTSFDAGAEACPFVALELDRDRRSERPDYRHRCYAEPTPSPRTIAHQERYCLSPNFSGCPIFQDWAVRAAARPVPLPQGQARPAGVDARGGTSAAGGDAGAGVAAGGGMAAGGRMAAGAGIAAGGGMAAGAGTAAGAGMVAGAGMAASAATAGDGTPGESGSPEPWPDSMSSTPSAPSPAMTGESPVDGASDAVSPPDEGPAPTQLGAFDVDTDDDVHDQPTNLPPPLTASPPVAAGFTPPATDAAPRTPGAALPTPGAAPPAAEAASPPGIEPAAAVPAFLVGRSTRSRNAQSVDEKIVREDVVPSWELDGRFGAESGPGPDRPSSFSRLLTIIAVVVILGLGVAAVIIVPGLLSSQPRSTVRPSFATVPSPSRSPVSSSIAGVPTVSPSAIPTAARPTDTPDPTAQPTAAASPETYRIRPGDTLAKIARRNDITVPELLAANPQITNPDHVEVGQVIFIPPPSSTPAP